MKTIHYVMVAHELSGDSEIMFFSSEHTAEMELQEFLSDIENLYDLEIDIVEEKTFKSMYINDVPEYDYCSVYVEVGVIVAEDTHDYYFANFTPSIYESSVKTDTKENVLAEVKRWEEDYAQFEKEVTESENEIQIHFDLRFMNAIDTIRAGKIITI
jgi:hypothetical protein